MDAYDSIVSPELGSQANPIVVLDEFVPSGSASDPIVVPDAGEDCHYETDHDGSNADTEPMDTVEFWKTVNGEHSTAPADQGEAVDSSSARTFEDVASQASKFV